MALFQRKTPLEKEWELLMKREGNFRKKQQEKKENLLIVKFSEKVPAKLQGTLDGAFAKAFRLIFEKGTNIIEKTYNGAAKEKRFQVNALSDQLLQNRKSLRAYGREAAAAGRGNTLLSAVAGIGMGLMGVGLPDIPLFTSLLLKNIYEVAISYGYDYKTPEEQYFILLLIEGANSYGEDFLHVNNEIDQLIRWGQLPPVKDLSKQIEKAAASLSKELLTMKFIQGIPIVGAVGGAYDMVAMAHVSDYARLKYQRRLLTKKRNEMK